MHTETFEDLCSVVVKQREEITALRSECQRWQHDAEICKTAADTAIAQHNELVKERDFATEEASDARKDAVKRAEADRLRLLDAQNEVLRLKALIAVTTAERDQLRAKLEAATMAVHTAPAVPKLDMLGKTVRHSTGRVGVVTGVTTESVDGHDLTRYTVKRTDGVTGSQIWHASNCTIVEDGAKPEPQPASIPSKVAEPEPRKHPVPVGEWVRRTVKPSYANPGYDVGDIRQVICVDTDGDYYVRLPEPDQDQVCWARAHCEPCDPPEGAA